MAECPLQSACHDGFTAHVRKKRMPGFDALTRAEVTVSIPRESPGTQKPKFTAGMLNAFSMAMSLAHGVPQVRMHADVGLQRLTRVMPGVCRPELVIYFPWVLT